MDYSPSHCIVRGGQLHILAVLPLGTHVMDQC
jgi:hypothetical protein